MYQKGKADIINTEDQIIASEKHAKTKSTEMHINTWYFSDELHLREKKKKDNKKTSTHTQTQANTNNQKPKQLMR